MTTDDDFRLQVQARRERQRRLLQPRVRFHKPRVKAVHHCACGRPATVKRYNDFCCPTCCRVLGSYYDWRNQPSRSLYSENRVVVIHDLVEPVSAVEMLMEC